MEIKQKQYEDAMRIQEQLEQENSGGFERIYPIDIENALIKH